MRLVVIICNMKCGIFGVYLSFKITKYGPQKQADMQPKGHKNRRR
jgi:hypothetical protein